ncbi:DUF4392 domain-containing protein [Psychrosphaera sp. B3R10]|uniref:glutamate cyclase domain-containing protein n=1 Tax=unclassified Psychrosphaera TaxID=2641570 RepID=UPI001C0A0637|nr:MULTISPECIES: glutamate cyclase domain-containing protein [unclassified Psychrosphaera]MBU2881709.1 DUF4392 domain-containing protein [Psychrosphaera sp. I2R16]MBU2991036.1 DUF4392 domain-containing protein [Psychrosphaera sp. B3R10]
MKKTSKQISCEIEDRLVALDVRGMQFAQRCLSEGYYYRAAKLLNKVNGTVLIGTGFPIDDTYETDGPVGAIVLYQALKSCGMSPIIVCGDPLYSALEPDFDCLKLRVDDDINAKFVAQSALADIEPDLIISIERPGSTADGTYRNMFGLDISSRCARFDDFILYASCPTIGIGDGGNEIGMGNIANKLAKLDIHASTTRCDELLVADVSNWAAYGLLGMLGVIRHQDYLANVNPKAILQYLSDRGSVDGVTKQNTLTEDSLSYTEGLSVIADIRALCGNIENKAQETI